MSIVGVVVLNAGIYFTEHQMLFRVNGLSKEKWDEKNHRLLILKALCHNFGSSYVLRDIAKGVCVDLSSTNENILSDLDIDDFEIQASEAPVYFSWVKIIFMTEREYNSNYQGIDLTQINLTI